MEAPLYKIVNFAAGSYIILEGERKSPQFFIIKDGKVNLKRDFPVLGEKPNELLGPGDFFGVIAAMSQYPQIESAVAITPVTLIGVANYKFGELIQKNSPLAMKIIRYFSKKLRQFDEPVGTSAGKHAMSSQPSPEANLNILFNLSEFYFMQGQISTCIYMLQSYLKYLPDGEFSEKAKSKLEMLGAPIVAEEDESGTTRHYATDQMIFCENEPGNDLYIVQKGRIKISKIIQNNDVILNIMKPGDIFGEMALLDNKPRSASAIAMDDDVELMVINKKNFEVMTKQQPQLMTRIITILSERIWNAYKKVANSQLPDLNARISDMLMTIAERGKAKIGPRATFDFKITLFELLKMLGLTDRDQAGVLKFLSINKFIKLEGENLVCSDLALLDRLVHQHREKLKESRGS
ncbi:MAG: cyclic nucleotide-binding domain-containing protein [Leptospiraceae bacterium]|nr:cyclic nucleotide-binding domain-containing protein [Leptospiraceae bacterium]MCP5511580.1 cyclic nucleotide-binding domain-containing protein [Leptospiraceae bacterium]